MVRSKILGVASFMAAVGFTGAVTAQEQQVNDPLEGMNRAVHGFNEVVDKAVFKPLAQGYRFIAPDFVEEGVSNFFDNLFYPTTIINQFLQGKFETGVQDFTRFALNTTLGIGGLFDVASQGGLKEHKEDFGQTFGVWGMGTGPYLVLPFWGPSNVRDGVGSVAGLYTNPIHYVEDDTAKYSLLAMSIIDTRAEMLKAEELITGDKYLFMRDAYLQRRQFMVNDKKVEEHDPFLDEQVQ